MKKVSNYDVAKEVGKKIGRGIGYAIGSLYVGPTIVRKLNDNDINSEWEWQIAGLAVFGGFAGLCINSGIVSDVIKSPLGFLIPVSTQLASGLYELGRYTKNEMQEKLEKTSGEKLEDRVINS